MGKRALLTTMLALALLPASARADGFGILGAAGSVDHGPYRYVSLVPATRPHLSVVERLDRRDTTVDRWWYLHGSWYLPAVAYDGSPGGLSADGGTLVLTSVPHAYPPRRTRFAVLDTRLFLRHPGKGRRPHAITYVTLPGAFSFDAISPNGSRAYLIQNFYSRRRLTHYDVRALDLASGRLLPGRIVDPKEPEERMEGSPIARLQSPRGRWAYTLYEAKTPFLHALDTVRGRAVCVDLPQLAGQREPFQLTMALGESGGRITVSGHPVRKAKAPAEPLVEIDTKTFAVSPAGATATASRQAGGAAGLPWLAIAAVAAAIAGAAAWRRKAAR
jgi:hypothetical protein